MEQAQTQKDLPQVTVHRESKEVKSIYKTPKHPLKAQYQMNHSQHFKTEKLQYVDDKQNMVAQKQNLVMSFQNKDQPLFQQNQIESEQGVVQNNSVDQEPKPHPDDEENEAVPIQPNFKTRAMQQPANTKE